MLIYFRNNKLKLVSVFTLEKDLYLTLMLQKAELAKNNALQILVWLDYTK